LRCRRGNGDSNCDANTDRCTTDGYTFPNGDGNSIRFADPNADDDKHVDCHGNVGSFRNVNLDRNVYGDGYEFADADTERDADGHVYADEIVNEYSHPHRDEYSRLCGIARKRRL
jgi:hypothetical protein